MAREISFIYFFLLIHLTNKEMNKNEEIVSNTVTRIINNNGLSAGSVAGMDNNNNTELIKCLL
jgi:hypothetical protein